MRKIVAGLVIAVGLASHVQAAGDPEAGQAKAAVCTACHGADGNSMVPNFPKLAGQVARYTVDQLTQIKSGARVVPEMMGIVDNLTQQDMEDLAAYYASQKGSVGAANAELVEVGKALYRGGNLAKNVPACAACHMPTGQGNGPAAYPKLGGQHAVYIAGQLEKFRKGERQTDGDTRIMRDIAAKLSDAEIQAVASYISGLHP